MGRIFPFLTKILVTVAIGSGLGLIVLLARGPARFDVLLARGPARFDVLLARGPARFDVCSRAESRAPLVPAEACSLGPTHGLAGFLYSKAYAQGDGVFRYQDRNGRTVYTNLEGSASHGKALTRVTLPALSSTDFAKAKPEELRAIDAQIRESHSELQAGQLCEAIRKASRTAQRSRLWEDHGRKISVAGALLAFAALLGFVGAGRRLGSLWPLPPIAGCLFLGYATWRDVQVAREAVTAGLRACSEQLPDGDADDKTAVEGRLGRARDLQNIITNAYAQQSADIEAAMRER